MSGMITKPIAVITTMGCPYCKRVKEALKNAGFDYSEVELSSHRDVLQALKQQTGRRTVPQVFVGGELVGGSDDTIAAIDDGSLRRRVDDAGGSHALPQSLQALLATVKPAGDATAAAALPPAVTDAVEYEKLRKLVEAMDVGAHAIARSTQKHGAFGRDAVANVFNGKAAVDWIAQHGSEWFPTLDSRSDALQLARKLQQAQLITSASTIAQHAERQIDDSDDGWWRLVRKVPRPSKPSVALNAHYHWFGAARGANDVSNALRARILTLYDKHLSKDGKAVDYNALAHDADFAAYIDATAELQKVEVGAMNREERIAFFINIYNALVVHATALFGAPSALLQRLLFFSTIRYNIGGMEYSCDDIEHGVLRSNATSPASVGAIIGVKALASKQFKHGDARLQYIVEPKDPRIHFALVCGAKSCPPIKLYTPDNLDEGLNDAGFAFCESEVQVDTAKASVELSKIFKWYGGDFGENQTAQLQHITKFLSGNKQAALQQLLSSGRPITVHFKEYDWSVNKK